MKKLLNLRLYKAKKIENEYLNIKSLYTNDTYTFKIDGVKTSINKKMFIRENNEFKFSLNLITKEGLYLLKENDMLFDIEVLKLSSKFTDNNIILEYRLSSDEDIIKIEIDIEGDVNE